MTENIEMTDTIDLDKKIIKQIEYYFGDINLPKDKFLRDLVGKEDGWVPVSTLFTFKRLKQLAETEEKVVSAIENVKSDLVELNETKDKIRRTTELPDFSDENTKLEFKQKTVHIKGFPLDAKLDEIIEFCSQYGKVESVLMKKAGTSEKKFKGCVFAIFADVESAIKAISSNDKFKDQIELTLRENKETYFNRKKTNKHVKKESKLVNLETAENEKPEEETNGNEAKSEEEVKFESGCCVKLFNLPEGITFKEIRPKLTEQANVRYVDIFPETHTGLIRFATKEDTSKAIEAFGYIEANKNETKDENNDENKVNETNTEEATKDEADGEKKNVVLGKLKLNDAILEYSLLDGDEEVEYWKKIQKIRSNMDKKGKKFKNKGRFGGKKRFNNKRKAGNDTNNAKKARVDAE